MVVGNDKTKPRIIFEYLLDEDVNSSNNYEQLLVMIKREFFEYISEKDDGKILLKRIPYQDLTDIIFNDPTTTYELNEQYMERIRQLKEICESGEEIRAITKFDEKITSHVELAKVQKSYIDNNVESVMNDFSERLEAVSDSLKNIENRTQNVYGEFIGILGIFSALIFGLFSGFSVLTSAISDFSKGVPLGNSIIYISIIAMALLTFVYFLLDWVGILIQRPIHHEKSELKEDQYSNVQNIFNRLSDSLNKGRKTPRDLTFVEKHRTYIFLMELLIVTCLIGVIVSVIQQQITPNYLSMIFSIILCLLPLYFIIKHIISSIRR